MVSKPVLKGKLEIQDKTKNKISDRNLNKQNSTERTIKYNIDKIQKRCQKNRIIHKIVEENENCGSMKFNNPKEYDTEFDERAIASVENIGNLDSTEKEALM